MHVFSYIQLLLLSFHYAEELKPQMPCEIEFSFDNTLGIPADDIDFSIDCYGMHFEKPR